MKVNCLSQGLGGIYKKTTIPIEVISTIFKKVSNKLLLFFFDLYIEIHYTVFVEIDSTTKCPSGHFVVKIENIKFYC
jgi:hypothetical protein